MATGRQRFPYTDVHRSIMCNVKKCQKIRKKKPSIRKWLNKLWFNYITKSHAAIKMNKVDMYI